MGRFLEWVKIILSNLNRYNRDSCQTVRDTLIVAHISLNQVLRFRCLSIGHLSQLVACDFYTHTKSIRNRAWRVPPSEL